MLGTHGKTSCKFIKVIALFANRMHDICYVASDVPHDDDEALLAKYACVPA